MRVFNIVWDMDNDDYINLNEQDALPPKEVFIPDLVWDEEIENVNGVADWLSDQYGFCVDSFDLDDMKETDDDYDHYEVCSNGFWYKFYERDNAVAFACRNEYPIYGVKDGKREPVEI